ncbi:anti-sigma factor [Cohnella hashimotonis]|uniref:Anti-sigma-W factor RsiW n=1 Tax=Cohnella hashimotonis TaxID=2826895 RepID=A0ABT6TRE8_9BACL|nr:anti-sigma factor [Cohnella hashimotonis]MDI4649414.1 anti-sigma factor [Cohnella hashimotonis]
MQDKQRPLCDLCLSVLTGECSDEERLAFERHLPGCEACRAEWNDLEVAWGALYADMEKIKPPEDLKRQVMDAALAADLAMAKKPDTKKAETAPGRRNSRRTGRGRWLAVSASVLLILLAVSSVWNYKLSRENGAAPLPIERALSVTASQVKLAVPLRAEASEASQAFGIACIVDNGKSRQFVVYVYGASPTSGEEAYQVWLLKDGVRKSAGTFRVADNDQGLGVLAMPIEADSLDFDKIGITLEPDDRGSQPRGEKMFGSV